jgi:hypothetical protein
LDYCKKRSDPVVGEGPCNTMVLASKECDLCGAGGSSACTTFGVLAAFLEWNLQEIVVEIAFSNCLIFSPCPELTGVEF